MGTSKGHGKYLTPEELLSLWDEYKAQVGCDTIEQATPKGDIVQLNIQKPLLRSGFEAFVFRKLGISVHSYLDNDKGLYADYSRVVACIRKEWETDQVSGTLTGKYKAPNLTARLNGLTEKTDVTTNGKEINEIKVNIVKPSGDSKHDNI
jgi:hypothetical protein